MKVRWRPLIFATAGLSLLALSGGRASLEILGHLMFGFAPFLRLNLERMTINADTLVPGLLAFFLIIVILHFTLRSFFKCRGVPWSVHSTCVVALLLPALLGTSLLVPGIVSLLQELGRG